MSVQSPKPNSNTPSPSKKRLLSPNYKTKQSPSNQPGSSTSPDDEQLLFAQKKTRDLPNLSDCHGCGIRINHTNPQDRLLILDSVWRIVLLCRKCIKRVQLGQNCPYCFKECVSEECVKCSDCRRQIHKDCVVSYGDSSPWFLCKRELGSGLEGFSVCLDCWVPEVFKRSIRIVRKKKVGKDLEKVRWNCKSVNTGNRRQVDVFNDGGCSIGKEVVLALMAPHNPNSKNAVSRTGLGVADGALEFNNSKRIGGSSKSGSVTGVICYKRMRAVKDVDGEHRVLNSVDDEGAGVLSHCAMNESSFFPITYRTRDKKLEWKTYERGSLERKIFLEDIKNGASAEVVGIGGLRQYERGSLKRKVFIENIKASAEVVGISRPCLYERGSLKRKIFLESLKTASAEVVGKPCPDSTTEIPLSEVCNLNKLEHVDDNKCTNQMKFDSDATMIGEPDNENFDRYLLKYSKRQAVHRSQLSG